MDFLLSPTTILLVLAAFIGEVAQAQAPKAPTLFTGNPTVGSIVGGWKYLGCSTEILAGR
ncbi:hypothetical protein PG994_003061 [Apiospora phragmitis]|uniref:Uncharacterized protein n=1 Tax=Apiospora phragmitis TaxID=2905665 RepID=A0ABR1W704_9PEZI